jgi:hypothetical protein
MLSVYRNFISTINKNKLNQIKISGCFFLLVSLSIINLGLSTTKVAASEIENKSITQTIAANNSFTQSKVSPHQLVFLAYQGYFVNQGIPKYVALTTAYNSRRVTSKDLVNAAIKSNRLPANSITDANYLNNVENFLTDLSND